MSSSCRICFAPLSASFCDLGSSPLANEYLTAAELAQGDERWYPLHAFVCSNCKLVQIDAEETPERIFSRYAYFSSYSSSWVQHARDYAGRMIERCELEPNKSLVMEIASNDGYLLQHFAEVGIPVVGIEPAANVAAVARAKGIRTEICFFGTACAQRLLSQYGTADLVAANNVIAHVPDLHDFIGGVKTVLAPGGIATFEFPHLLRLIEETQFDTIYHEHFSYFALAPLLRALRQHGLAIVDVEQLPTHGGSLRVFVAHEGAAMSKSPVQQVLELERAHGLHDMHTYLSFQQKVDRCRDALLRFVEQARAAGESIAAYGAPAKGNTLLNYCRLDCSRIAFTVDRSPHKQGRFLPGSHIPIFPPQKVRDAEPDIVLILPWNLKTEIMEQMADVRSWGGRFVVAIPQVSLIE